MLPASDVPPPAKILICDDERHIVRLIQVNLERQGYTVFTAFNGAEALEILRSEEIRVIAIDASLTTPSTQEVLDELRQLPGGDDVTIILLRSRFDPPDDLPGIGPNSSPPPVVLDKSFNPSELIPILKPKRARFKL